MEEAAEAAERLKMEAAALALSKQSDATRLQAQLGSSGVPPAAPVQTLCVVCVDAPNNHSIQPQQSGPLPQPAGGGKKEKERQRKERQRLRKMEEAKEVLQGAMEAMAFGARCAVSLVSAWFSRQA